MNRTNLKMFSTAIANAALSRKTALNLECAVAFAVHLDSNQNKRLSREALCEVFASAGYKCAKPGEIDWKSINRRITAALALFDFISAEEVTDWINGKQKTAMLDAIVTKLEPMKLRSTNEILEICGKTGPAAQQRRLRQPPEGTQQFETAHIKFSIPPTATRQEVLEIAISLMKLAEQMASDMLGATDVATDTIASARARAEAKEHETVDA